MKTDVCVTPVQRAWHAAEAETPVAGGSGRQRAAAGGSGALRFPAAAMAHISEPWGAVIM